jgi:hypothetical protein
MGQGMTGAGRTPTVGGPSGPPAPSTYYAPNPEYLLAQENYAQAQDAYNRALARFNNQRTGLLRQYGYLGDVDPKTGMVKNIRVDTGNSFGQLQQLLHNAALEDESAVNAAEDRGVFGGLAHQGESEARYQHQAQLGALASALQGNLTDLDNQQVDAKSALDQALYTLTHTAAQTAIQNNEFNPANVPSTNTKSKANTVAAQIAARNIANAVKNTKKITKLHPGVTVKKRRGVISMH